MAPPPPQLSLLRPGSAQGCGTAPSTQTPSQMVAVTPQMTAVSPELRSQRRGNMCPAEYPLVAARGRHGEPSRPSNRNQEAEGMGAAPSGGWGHPAGVGGAASRDSRPAGRQQAASNRAGTHSQAAPPPRAAPAR